MVPDLFTNIIFFILLCTALNVPKTFANIGLSPDSSLENRAPSENPVPSCQEDTQQLKNTINVIIQILNKNIREQTQSTYLLSHLRRMLNKHSSIYKSDDIDGLVDGIKGIEDDELALRLVGLNNKRINPKGLLLKKSRCAQAMLKIAEIAMRVYTRLIEGSIVCDLGAYETNLDVKPHKGDSKPIAINPLPIIYKAYKDITIDPIYNNIQPETEVYYDDNIYVVNPDKPNRLIPDTSNEEVDPESPENDLYNIYPILMNPELLIDDDLKNKLHKIPQRPRYPPKKPHKNPKNPNNPLDLIKIYKILEPKDPYGYDKNPEVSPWNKGDYDPDDNGIPDEIILDSYEDDDNDDDPIIEVPGLDTEEQDSYELDEKINPNEDDYDDIEDLIDTKHVPFKIKPKGKFVIDHLINNHPGHVFPYPELPKNISKKKIKLLKKLFPILFEIKPDNSIDYDKPTNPVPVYKPKKKTIFDILNKKLPTDYVDISVDNIIEGSKDYFIEDVQDLDGAIEEVIVLPKHRKKKMKIPTHKPKIPPFDESSESEETIHFKPHQMKHKKKNNIFLEYDDPSLYPPQPDDKTNTKKLIIELFIKRFPKDVRPAFKPKGPNDFDRVIGNIINYLPYIKIPANEENGPEDSRDLIIEIIKLLLKLKIPKDDTNESNDTNPILENLFDLIIKPADNPNTSQDSDEVVAEIVNLISNLHGQDSDDSNEVKADLIKLIMSYKKPKNSPYDAEASSEKRPYKRPDQLGYFYDILLEIIKLIPYLPRHSEHEDSDEIKTNLINLITNLKRHQKNKPKQSNDYYEIIIEFVKLIPSRKVPKLIELLQTNTKLLGVDDFGKVIVQIIKLIPIQKTPLLKNLIDRIHELHIVNEDPLYMIPHKDADGLATESSEIIVELLNLLPSLIKLYETKGVAEIEFNPNGKSKGKAIYTPIDVKDYNNVIQEVIKLIPINKRKIIFDRNKLNPIYRNIKNIKHARDFIIIIPELLKLIPKNKRPTIIMPYDPNRSDEMSVVPINEDITYQTEDSVSSSEEIPSNAHKNNDINVILNGDLLQPSLVTNVEKPYVIYEPIHKYKVKENFKHINDPNPYIALMNKLNLPVNYDDAALASNYDPDKTIYNPTKKDLPEDLDYNLSVNYDFNNSSEENLEQVYEDESGKISEINSNEKQFYDKSPLSLSHNLGYLLKGDDKQTSKSLTKSKPGLQKNLLPNNTDKKSSIKNKGASHKSPSVSSESEDNNYSDDSPFDLSDFSFEFEKLHGLNTPDDQSKDSDEEAMDYIELLDIPESVEKDVKFTFKDIIYPPKYPFDVPWITNIENGSETFAEIDKNGPITSINLLNIYKDEDKPRIIKDWKLIDGKKSDKDHSKKQHCIYVLHDGKYTNLPIKEGSNRIALARNLNNDDKISTNQAFTPIKTNTHVTTKTLYESEYGKLIDQTIEGDEDSEEECPTYPYKIVDKDTANKITIFSNLYNSDEDDKQNYGWNSPIEVLNQVTQQPKKINKGLDTSTRLYSDYDFTGTTPYPILNKNVGPSSSDLHNYYKGSEIKKKEQVRDNISIYDMNTEKKHRLEANKKQPDGTNYFATDYMGYDLFDRLDHDIDKSAEYYYDGNKEKDNLHVTKEKTEPVPLLSSMAAPSYQNYYQQNKPDVMSPSYTVTTFKTNSPPTYTSPPTVTINNVNYKNPNSYYNDPKYNYPQYNLENNNPYSSPKYDTQNLNQNYRNQYEYYTQNQPSWDAVKPLTNYFPVNTYNSPYRETSHKTYPDYSHGQNNYFDRVNHGQSNNNPYSLYPPAPNHNIGHYETLPDKEYTLEVSPKKPYSYTDNYLNDIDNKYNNVPESYTLNYMQQPNKYYDYNVHPELKSQLPDTVHNGNHYNYDPYYQKSDGYMNTPLQDSDKNYLIFSKRPYNQYSRTNIPSLLPYVITPPGHFSFIDAEALFGSLFGPQPGNDPNDSKDMSLEIEKLPEKTAKVAKKNSGDQIVPVDAKDQDTENTPYYTPNSKEINDTENDEKEMNHEILSAKLSSTLEELRDLPLREHFGIDHRIKDLIREIIEDNEKYINPDDDDPEILRNIYEIKQLASKNDITFAEYVEILQLYQRFVNYMKQFDVNDKTEELHDLITVANQNKFNSTDMLEMTYLVKSPKPVIYYPYYYVKYRLPFTQLQYHLDKLTKENDDLELSNERIKDEVLKVSNIVEVSEDLKAITKDDLLKLTLSTGDLVTSKILKNVDTGLNNLIGTVDNLKTDIDVDDVDKLIQDIKVDLNNQKNDRYFITWQGELVNDANNPKKVMTIKVKNTLNPETYSLNNQTNSYARTIAENNNVYPKYNEKLPLDKNFQIRYDLMKNYKFPFEKLYQATANADTNLLRASQVTNNNKINHMQVNKISGGHDNKVIGYKVTNKQRKKHRKKKKNQIDKNHDVVVYKNIDYDDHTLSPNPDDYNDPVYVNPSVKPVQPIINDPDDDDDDNQKKRRKKKKHGPIIPNDPNFDPSDPNYRPNRKNPNDDTDNSNDSNDNEYDDNGPEIKYTEPTDSSDYDYSGETPNNDNNDYPNPNDIDGPNPNSNQRNPKHPHPIKSKLHHPNPYQPNPNQPNPYQPNPNRPNPNQPNPYQPSPNRPNPNQPNPYQPNPNRPNPYQPNPNRPNPNQQYPNQPNPNQPNPNRPNPNQPNPNQPNPYQPNPNRPNPYQPNPNQQYPNRPNPYQPNPNQQYPNQPNPNQQYPNQSNPNQQYPNQPNPYQPNPNRPNPNRPNPNQQYPNQQYPNQPGIITNINTVNDNSMKNSENINYYNTQSTGTLDKNQNQKGKTKLKVKKITYALYPLDAFNTTNNNDSP